MDCNCPQPASLTEIPTQDCSVNLKQIQRLAFQRNGTANQFDTDGILELADWQAFQTAVDDTKIIITPLLAGNPTIESGEAITTGGGDNSTLNGIEEVEGVNPSSFSAEYKGLSAEIEKALKTIMCEKQLTVYLLLEGGRIASFAVDATTDKGFLIQTPFVSDRNNSGFATKDVHNVSFELPAGWSENLVIKKPNFNPLTEL